MPQFITAILTILTPKRPLSEATDQNQKGRGVLGANSPALA